GGAERLSSGSVHLPTLPRAAVASHTAVDLGRGRSGTRPGAGFPGSPPTIALRSTTDRRRLFSGRGAARDATALAMVLPQELHHFSRFHGGVDADRRGGFAVPPAVLTDDHPTTVRPLHDFGMVDFSHRSTPRQPHSTLLTPQGWMPGRRRPPVGTRRFREPPVARYPTGRPVGDSG